MSGRGNCAGLVGRIFGHRMRPRYNETREMPSIKADGGFRADVSALREMMTKSRTYHGDVCERCGYTVSPLAGDTDTREDRNGD